MKFTKEDVPDQVQLKESIDELADIIYASNYLRHGRTYEKVQAMVGQGIIAEEYLIQNLGFENDRMKYHDVKKDGVCYEIKAWSITPTTEKIISQHLIKFRKWRKYGVNPNSPYNCSKLIIFAFNKGVYEFYKMYDIDSGEEVDYE
jgi:hypothetical protein